MLSVVRITPLYALQIKMRSFCAYSPIFNFVVSPFMQLISIGNAERNHVNYRWLFLFIIPRFILLKKNTNQKEREEKKRNIRYTFSCFMHKITYSGLLLIENEPNLTLFALSKWNYLKINHSIGIGQLDKMIKNRQQGNAWWILIIAYQIGNANQ